ncbi:MAG: carboxypeptidase M32 [Anaerolineae bacterium]
MTAYQDFQAHIASINDLLVTLSVLQWDARTQMPPGGSETRGHQMATLSALAADQFAGEKTARLLDAAEAEVQGDDPDSYRVRAVRQTREAYAIARRIPSSLVSEMAAHEAIAQSVWEAARPANDFARFAPYLERTVALQRHLADAIGYDAHPYDALLKKYEPSMTAARLADLFGALKARSLPLLKRIVDSGVTPRTDFLAREYPEAKQRAFGLEIAQLFGYDLRRGRLDKSSHPFEISFTREDVRMTTRYNERFLPAATFGTFHETGHALYEQGVAPELTRSALTTDLVSLYAVGGASFGAHESQSRLWENLVGRSRVFWRRHFGRLQEVFPAQLADVTAEEFYRAVNTVRPSLIRVEADEVTYNFHIMLRVEIEMALLDGRVSVAELPDVWRAKMGEYLGVTPPDDRQGVLQDIHWSSGNVGSFCTYTVGNVMSVQLFQAARQGVAGLDDALAAGDYVPLRTWLTENMYRHGRAFGVNELLTRTTGRGLDVDPYLTYLETKYSDLYLSGGSAV